MIQIILFYLGAGGGVTLESVKIFQYFNFCWFLGQNFRFYLFQHVYLLEIWAHMSFTKLKNVYSFPRPDVMKLANACGFGQKLGQNGTVSTVLDKNSADKNFRRTKLPKIGLGAENFVRRKFLSAENFVRRIFVR